MQLRDASLFKQECLVDGKWISSGGKESIPVTNPANNEQIGSVPKLGWRETAEAITAAERAWPAWKALTGTERGRFLRRWHALILENIDALAMILTTEQRMPLAEVKGVLQSGLSYSKWYAE